MLIAPHAAIQLPFHDARISETDITHAEDGYLNILIKVEVNHEESLEPFKEFGINNLKLELGFVNCWQVTANLTGYCSTPEVISDFDIIEPSELKQKLSSYGAGSATMTHFRIQGSAGSQLDFVAEAISVAERS